MDNATPIAIRERGDRPAFRGPLSKDGASPDEGMVHKSMWGTVQCKVVQRTGLETGDQEGPRLSVAVIRSKQHKSFNQCIADISHGHPIADICNGWVGG